MQQTNLIEEKENNNTQFIGWRHTNIWTYGIMFIVSAIALLTSLILSSETLALARAPHSKLACDVSGAISCSKVAQTWQAEFIHFGELSFPNSFFGIAAEAIFLTIAVIGLAKMKFPKWLASASWLGGLFALLYAYWLFSQSLFVINVLCPWCLVLMFSTTVQFISLSHATICVQGVGLRAAPWLKSYYRLNYDLMLDAVWIMVLVTLIFATHGSEIIALFTK